MIALIAAIMFARLGLWLPFWITLIVGLVEFISEREMNARLRGSMSNGLNLTQGLDVIPNGLTVVNFLTTTGCWGMGIYAVVATFFGEANQQQSQKEHIQSSHQHANNELPVKLNNLEIGKLLAEAEKLRVAFESGDADYIVKASHPVLYDLSGGKDVFERAVRQLVDDSSSAGIIYESNNFDNPTHLYPAGSNQVCFVPRERIASINGMRMRDKTFLIAARPISGGEWLFIDGSVLARDPKMLWKFFPKLPKNVTTPPISEIRLK